MEVSYIKDLHNNYLVLPKGDDNGETYCVRMLQANSIEGIIKPDKRTIDNSILYYYDITAKQTIDILYNKNPINLEQIRSLFTSLSDIIEQSYKYLLNENDLLINPEYIYYELASMQVRVCYLPGYNKDIRKQMASLIEYIMNKVEYKDKEAVLYVYNLYAVCRNEEYSFINLLSAIKEKIEGNPANNEKKKIGHIETYKNKKSEPVYEDNYPRNLPPLMMEKISEDKEQVYYPLSTYIYTGFCLIGPMMVLFICIKSKIIYNSFGNRIEYGKLMVLILILICVVGYFLRKIWDKKNRLTRIVSEEEYVDPRKINKTIIDTNTKQNQTDDELYSWPGVLEAEENDKEPIKNSTVLLSTDNNISPTVLLNGNTTARGCCFIPENTNVYEEIQINKFPFIIGKSKGNVDYCLDKEIISRYHVKITKEDDICYITDLNSTNGTCLNENPLPCYKRHEIKDGDQVGIAGIKYLFNIV